MQTFYLVVGFLFLGLLLSCAALEIAIALEKRGEKKK